MARHVFLTLTNPIEGRTKEYEDWYFEHIEDVLKLPGFVSAQRFKLSPHQKTDGPHPYGYMSLYEIETDDLEGMIQTINETLGSSAMPVSGALDPERLTLVFEPMARDEKI